jgi:hypothetical protein
MSVPPAPPPPRTGPSLRVRGVALFVAVLIEILIGNELAIVGTPYPEWLIGLHVVVALLLVIFSAYATFLAFRAAGTGARASAVLAAVGSLGASIGGSVFLYNGSAPALTAMEGLGGLALLGALLLILLGGARPVSGTAAGT